MDSHTYTHSFTKVHHCPEKIHYKKLYRIEVLTNWVASYFSSLHTTLLHGRTFSSIARDEWRITSAQQLTVLGVELVPRLAYRDRRKNILENCTTNSLADLAKKY